MIYQHLRSKKLRVEAERILVVAFRKLKRLPVIMHLEGYTNDLEHMRIEFFDPTKRKFHWKEWKADLVSPSVVAKKFGISLRTVRRWKCAFGWRQTKFGHRTRYYSLKEINDWVRKHTYH